MSATILDAIQNIATPAMIKAATSALGVSDSHATSGLAAASTSILGGLLQNSGDAGMMAKVAGLIAATTPDANMFANMTSMLGGGLPASPIHTLGNRILGLVFGDKMAGMMSAISAATGISPKASSGLTTLAAPMVLAALRNKLGAAPTAASLVGLLTADKGVIAGAMPPALRSKYGLANLAPATAAVAPVAAAVAAAVAPKVAAVVAPVVAAAAASPIAHSSSGHASTTVTTAAPAPHVAPVAQAAKPVAPVAAPAPAAHAAPPHAPAPVVRPMAPAAPAAHQAALDVVDTSSHMGAKIAMLVGGALLTALIWYWAYGRTPAPIAPAPKPVAAAAPAAPAPKPAPAPVAAAPAPPTAPAAAPAPAAPVSTQLVAVPGANGLVKYMLPGGASIEVAKDGLESKMLTFINTKDAAIDNTLWFDFDRLTFVTASSDLTPESKAQVASAVAILKAYPAVSVKVGGYTDNQGNPDANLDLSDKRANRVMQEMIGGGVAADRIEAKGYGDQHPIGDNATPEGRAKNRRTSLSIRTK